MGDLDSDNAESLPHIITKWLIILGPTRYSFTDPKSSVSGDLTNDFIKSFAKYHHL